MKPSRRKMLSTSLRAAAMSLTTNLFVPKNVFGYTHAEAAARLIADEPPGKLTKADLPTPSLLLDLDVFDANLARMRQHAQTHRVHLRPHGKSHKCVEIALRQLRAGAKGICAATISEAEMFAAAGVKGVLITAEMVGRNKVSRLVQLARQHPDLMSVVDHPAQAEQLSEAARAARVTLNVLMDIDPNMKRTGIPAGVEAIALAEKIMKLPNLKLRGIQCYSGASAHVTGWEARRAHSHQALTPGLETAEQLKRAGMPLEIFSGGSTGTYNIDVELKGLTELQVGSYVFMDIEYRDCGGKSGAVYNDFGQSLFVLGTVISQSHKGLATVDAGIKAFATDRKFGPELKDISGVEFRYGGDEHGILILKNPSREIRHGDKLEFIVPHCDPNVNLYDRLYGVRGDKVETVWKIGAQHGG